MQVVLLEDVKALGRQGELVEVPDGYATHFLFPQHMAVESVGKSADESEKEVSATQKKEEERERALATEIDGLEVTIPVRVEEGEVLEPVTSTQLRAALKDQGVVIEKKLLQFKPLTELGRHEVFLEFPSGFEATLTVNVEPA